MKISFYKSTKNLSFNILVALGLIVILTVLFNYNKKKFGKVDGFNEKGNHLGSSELSEEKPEDNLHSGDTPVSGIVTNPSKDGTVSTDPSDLLPKGSNEWSDLNNVTQDLKNINLLSAGHHYGINTVGSSLRNPNLQIRSEPIIPKAAVGPWNNTTIDADTTRRSLEIDGCD